MCEFYKVQRTECKEIKDKDITHIESAVRFYRDSPDSFLLQIRSLGPMVDGGVQKFAIANAHVTRADIVAMLEYIDSQ